MSPQSQLLEAICRRDELQSELDAAALRVSECVCSVVWSGAMSQSQLAALLGLSRQRVSQLVARSERALEAEDKDRRAASYGMSRKPDMRGLESGSIPCFSCGKFKSEPAAVCGQCGDDPVSYNGSREEFNRAYGYAA